MMVLQLRVQIDESKNNEKVNHTFDLDVLANETPTQHERDLVEEMENYIATLLRRLYPELKTIGGAKA